jgi:CheY-like chemotaxis protein
MKDLSRRRAMDDRLMFVSPYLATNPALKRVLVIDPSGELRGFLRFCAGRCGQNLQIVSYVSARGCPDETCVWAGFDLVVLEHRLHNPHDRGIEWLRAIRRNPAAPAVVLIAGDLTESLRIEAKHVGAADVLNKNDLSPHRFAECLDRVLPGWDPDSRPAPSADPPCGSRFTTSADIAALQVPSFRIVRLIATMSRGFGGAWQRMKAMSGRSPSRSCQ